MCKKCGKDLEFRIKKVVICSSCGEVNVVSEAKPKTVFIKKEYYKLKKQ